jgi:hypothetical protein
MSEWFNRDQVEAMEEAERAAKRQASQSAGSTPAREEPHPICPICRVPLSYGGWRGSKECSKWVCPSCRRSMEISSFLPSEERKALVQPVSEVDTAGRMVSEPSREELVTALKGLEQRWQANADMLAEGNKSEGYDEGAGMQYTCARELRAVLATYDPSSGSAAPAQNEK